MKTSYFIIIIMGIALAGMAAKIMLGTSERKADDADSDTQTYRLTIETIMTRTSVRAYSDRPVSEATVDTLLRAAMAAPTARNAQPWQFVVITDRAILDSIAANSQNIKMAAEAPLAIAVCGDLSKAIEGDGQPYWIQDCSAATENLLLAAHAMGLGAVWCGIYPIPDRVAFVSSLLGLPEHIIPLNIIPIGYPKAAGTPKEKFDSLNIHYNNY